MRTATILSGTLAAALLSAGLAHAADGGFYNPSNAASPSGFTSDHELFRTIGCPGRELFGKPCDVVDSDGDGVPDYRDRCPNTPAGEKVDKDGCPLPKEAAPAPAPAPVPAPPPKLHGLEGANFDFDRAVVREADFANLDQDVAALKERSDIKVEVAGHTDSIGTEEYNMGLSVRRANAVRNYLIGKGIAADRLTVKGYGESRPIADNATEEGRFKNRRVELVPQP